MKLFLTTLFIGFSIVAFGQNTLIGTVSDHHNKPIESVTVSIPELHKETITDTNGTYTFNNLPNGNFSITFSSIGYANKTLIITLNQKETRLNTLLEETSTHMDEVIISTVFNKLQSQNVMKVEHQSVKDLQQKGAATLAEGLATIPGVSQISTGTSIGKPVIRGLSGNRVLVYSQGIRMENQQFGEEHGLGMSDAGVESVEVIKGPASLLYGSDALGGVLYFNPEKFAKANTFSGNFNQKLFSNTQGSNTSLGLKTSSDHWKFLTRGSYSTHADYEIPSGEKVINTRFIEKDYKIGIGYSDTYYNSEFRYNYNNLNIGLPEEDLENTNFRTPLYPKQDIDNHMLSLHQKFFFRNSKLEADLGYTFNNRKELEAVDEVALHMKLKTASYNIKYYLPKSGNLETILGVQGLHQTNKNNGEELLIPDASTNDIGVLLTSNYEWKSHTFQAGIRYDARKINTETHGIVGEEGYFKAIDRTFESFNTSLGYKTKLRDKLTLRLNIASGFRAPNLAELTSNGVHEGSNRYEIGNADLKNEQNIQTDLNLEYGNAHFEFFVNGFYNHVNNYIFISPNGAEIDGNNVYDYVQDNAALYGGEIGIHYHPHPLDWLHFVSSFENVTGKKDTGEYLPLIPANKFSNTIRTEFNIQQWFQKGYALVNLDYILKQNNNSAFETTSNDYTLLNLGFGGNINVGKAKFDLSLNANNLLNKTYVPHLSRLKTDGIPNIGRNIILGLNFNF
ncbi:TonB-dependent receptor [Flavobacterium saliperosum S13]|uniref:Iron complex outermembrane recepter protein n=2 Tax=Flavobacterium saliperosum TaxID=329186 RepID=A0A1G4VYJ6_9FLAO|nr:TonB-dependent receptor [Flavobacterium saliperosum]ESU26937.1 TonB-dependent receptor [Flavobacterium saliperosum S13]SCX13920.1 iron complex outermembrane recepter protein [Flavobacterium saliperosum]